MCVAMGAQRAASNRTDSITQPPSAARSWNVLRVSLRSS